MCLWCVDCICSHLCSKSYKGGNTSTQTFKDSALLVHKSYFLNFTDISSLVWCCCVHQVHLLWDFLLPDPDFVYCIFIHIPSFVCCFFPPMSNFHSFSPTISSALCPHSACLCRSGREAASAKGEAAAGGGRESQGQAGKEADSAAGWGSHGQRGTGKLQLVTLTQNPQFCWLCHIYTRFKNKVFCPIELLSRHLLITSSQCFLFQCNLLIVPLLMSLTVASLSSINLPRSFHTHPSLYTSHPRSLLSFSAHIFISHPFFFLRSISPPPLPFSTILFPSPPPCVCLSPSSPAAFRADGGPAGWKGPDRGGGGQAAGPESRRGWDRDAAHQSDCHPWPGGAAAHGAKDAGGRDAGPQDGRGIGKEVGTGRRRTAWMDVECTAIRAAMNMILI